jgi:hypothetical protein
MRISKENGALMTGAARDAETFVLISNRRRSIHRTEVFRRSFWSLIGNPVRVGDGPAAVTLPFSAEKGTPLAICTTVLTYRNGKVVKGAGKSENLPECTVP